ncbi:MULTISPECIES: glucose-6-phosphate dehydrogenase [Mycobacterium]|uniref:Glucose-6-phosphate 1-dehydrogenase n=1 Tax=Mycobacterium kiyosense TaxID=2871094 RepID=A0A9P3Q3Z0_9MYCO|nr:MULTISPECIES: glucose-6-phosphate dehydrogenase [Mycobacterium]BDB42412.1 glucose-6-phosphate 1-dehydrogenase [Mycobacterium kiyosense]BDE14318.1 glucose-6-phosphate 1-dehydrogenase [Mycobacterium sp. 20KCMC460]GLB81466.1 glucose-6-phosphate 1-dehydrogenase [Mycobacterium kiyosense]GLB90063.1 glucose-6-phosphate 1-dehydrogenase [Mycobacterium kiyosense]GLB93659.1 glucose-6-phosphate 1-dehydrogenase [Mycobacterium kiyosense]
MATKQPQTISYPATDARPHRHDTAALDPHVIVLFGATGDLAKRKLIPGLAYLDQSELAPDIQIIATSLEDLTDDEFRKIAKHAIESFGTHKLNADQWEDFARIVHYVPQGAGSQALAEAVAQAEKNLGPNVRRLHYLSVPPKAARDVITMLREANLVERSRVVMEKPFGTDLESAVALNDFVHETFEESQIFRIDHFLGKEAAQNILAFRFANGLFEPIWNRNFIDHIQIDIPETLGLDERANFYENTGAYKDMVVTHLFQVMAFVVMEPPTALEPYAISEEKNKVFRSMLPVKTSNVVRGQYAGYRKEKGVAKDSDTETFIALKVGIDNWRWAGVPIYLRTGKKMAEGIRIISIAFKEAPRTMFPPGSGVGTQGPDHLTFDLADNSKVSLSFYGKRPGPGMKLDKLSMQFSSQEVDTVVDVLEAYERLILDAMRGDHTLFTTAEGIESLWERSQDLLDDPPPAKMYQPGTWGPNAIHQLIAPNAWRLPFEREWRQAPNSNRGRQ